MSALSRLRTDRTFFRFRGRTLKFLVKVRPPRPPEVRLTVPRNVSVRPLNLKKVRSWSDRIRLALKKAQQAEPPKKKHFTFRYWVTTKDANAEGNECIKYATGAYRA